MTRSRAQQLRDEFDAAFARPPDPQRQPPERLLLLKVGSEPYALRVSQVGGLLRLGAITALPSRAPALLGLAGVRSELLPIFSLSVLLGYGRSVESPRWIVLGTRGTTRVGLGFEAFDGYFEQARDQVFGAEPAANARHHVLEVARAASGARGLISIPSIMQAIQEASNHG